MLNWLYKKFSDSKSYLQKPSFRIAIIVVVISLMALLIGIINKPVKPTQPEVADSTYVVGNITFPNKIEFAGEHVPLHIPRVREILATNISSLLENQAHVELLKERADRWFPLIEPILTKHKLPDDFKYVALIESYLSNVVSPQGAAGFWQLIEGTARKYNLEITDDVDERYDVIKSTHAAAKYFEEAFKNFNNWTLTAASYNLGITGVQNKLDVQSQSSYYTLKLNKETSIYLFKLIAAKELLCRPECYGLTLENYSTHKIIKNKKVTVDTTIHNLEEFAKHYHIHYEALQEANPWLISNRLLNNNNKKYILEIPQALKQKQVIDADSLEFKKP